MLIYFRCFFPPATVQNESSDVDDARADIETKEGEVGLEGDENVQPPSLPDVPTLEPTSADEPQLKRRKTEAEVTTTEIATASVAAAPTDATNEAATHTG